MANFSEAAIEEIERRIAFHVGLQSEQFGQFLVDGRAQVDEAKALLEKHTQTIGAHNTELHQNADRVSKLVEQVNKKDEEIKKLVADIEGFAKRADNQVSAFETKSNMQTATIDQLTRQTEEHLTKLKDSLLGIDEKISGSLEACKAATIAEVTDIRAQPRPARSLWASRLRSTRSLPSSRPGTAPRAPAGAGSAKVSVAMAVRAPGPEVAKESIARRLRFGKCPMMFLKFNISIGQMLSTSSLRLLMGGTECGVGGTECRVEGKECEVASV